MVSGLIVALGIAGTGWKAVAPGTWVCTIGKPDSPTLTEASESRPKLEGLKRLGSASLPFRLDEVVTFQGKDSVSISLPLAPNERIFGLGMQMEGCDRRGGIYHLRLDHFAQGHDRLHAPTPLYISSKGYAVFLNTSRPADFYVGVGNRLGDTKNPSPRDRNSDPKWDAQPPSGWVEASVQAKGLQVLVFSGPTAMNALQRYNLYCGGGAMPPYWALGFWHRMRSLADSKEIATEVAEFDRRGIPLDVLGLEPGWQTSSYPGTMEWDRRRFPDPVALSRLGPRINLWENPYVAPGSELYKGLGKRFGSHTVWLGAVPDIYDKQAARVEREFHQKHHPNVSGYKIDEVDGFDVWLWPDHATFPSGPDGIQMRQIYGLLWQKELDRMYRERGQRTFGLIRGSNGGASRFPFAIYSDTYDTRQYLTAIGSSSLAGVLWCAEIRSANNAEEWVRRMQMAILCPIAQLNAWDSGMKPWSFPEVEGIVRDAIRLRRQIQPYLYTTFAQYWRDGIPPVRPMCLVDGGLETDQYLLGDSLLVAPLDAKAKSRKVRLPQGEWFDFLTGVRVGSDETITITPSLAQIPLFVRGGSAIPVDLGTARRDGPPRDFGVRCYGKAPFRGWFYEDDGIGFGYEKGDFGLWKVGVVEGLVSTDLVEGKSGRIPPRATLVR